jgi:glyoxylase-like metal-dependent hydrolase (beta-lactamase superfamily II)
MTTRRRFLLGGLACATIPAWRSFAGTAATPPAGRGNEPVVVETPWGQRVVPTLDTYVDIQTYLQLRPGQAWSEGDALGRRLRDDYRSGRLKLRRYPWCVADGVFALGQAEMEQQIYLVDTGDGLLLIDPSLDAWQDELETQIRRLGFEPDQVKWVLLTHCHIDHGQSCARWRKRGARILVGDGDAHAMESCNSLVATWVEPQAGGRCSPCPVDERVFDGDVLQFGALRLHAVATPGHTPGSTCFHFERGGRQFLISGDIALHNGRHAWMGNPYADWTQYLASLGKLAGFSLDGRPVRFDVLLPGHGTVDLERAHRSVDATLRIVRTIVARRAAGEDIDWIEPYPWNWAQGIVYTRSR